MSVRIYFSHFEVENVKLPELSEDFPRIASKNFKSRCSEEKFFGTTGDNRNFRFTMPSCSSEKSNRTPGNTAPSPRTEFAASIQKII
ncbi:MAG: hypothetical protein FWD31_06865, partial [Planctomycetaceae bacterium]|nr:hypothetical protein [Planctomycetaceae bacterium]